VPILFGDNNFEIVQYGPQGQRRVINRRINASSFLAPKGAAYYRAAVYRPELVFSESKRNSGVRLDLRAAYGLAENFNIGGGFDSYEAGGRRFNIATLSGQTSLSGLAVNSEIAYNFDGTLAGQLEFQGNGRAAGIRGRITLAQEGFASERLFGNILSRIEINGDRGISFGPNSNGSLTGRLQFDRFHSGEYSFNARQRFVLSYGNAWLSQSLAWSHTSTGERRDKLDGEVAYSMRYGKHALRASMEYEIHPSPRVNRLSAVVERAFSVYADSWRWRVETNWERNENKFSYGLALSREFKALTFDFIAETDGRDQHRLGINLAFSLGRKGNGWGISGRPLAQAGTLRARVFEDIDEDGRFSSGDVPIQGAGVLAQSSLNVATTNAKGYAVLEGIIPNERSQVTVDTDELAANNLYARSTYILPREGTVYNIDVPMAQMGTIDGTVEMVGGTEGQSAPVGGINLALVNAQGQEIARTISAYDGFYSFDLVPAVSYRVVLAPDSSMAQILRPVEQIVIRTTRAEPAAQAVAMTLIENVPSGPKTALRGLL
jgi:outer membrane usher protein FimD/PapC